MKGLKKSLNVLGSENSFHFEERQAFYADCYNKYHDAIFSIAYNFFENEFDAKDQTIEFFEKLMSWPISRFEKQENLSGYILKSAYNHCITALKAKKRRMQNIVPLEHAMSLSSKVSSIEINLINNESIQAILAAIKLLPKNQQEVLLLAAQGYSHKEISDNLGIAESASTSRLSRARQKLKEILQ